jgi:REP element-mobilizing transposase RayT
MREDRMVLNACGQVAEDEWLRSAELRPGVEVDAFVIMPNHLHGVIVLSDGMGGPVQAGGDTVDEARAGDRRSPLRSGQGSRLLGAFDDLGDTASAGDRRSPLRTGPGSRSLGALVAGYKAAVTRRVGALQGRTPGQVWHRSYYEHVVRNDEDLARLREYIANNPMRWALDRENPDRSQL